MSFCVCPETTIFGETYTEYSQFFGSVLGEW